MSYTSQMDTRSRVTAIAGVAAVHAAMGIAIVVGLAATGAIKVGPKRLIAFPIDDPLPPPPPRPQPTEMIDPITPPLASPKPIVELPTNNTADVVESNPDAHIVDVPYLKPSDTGIMVEPPKPTPRPSFTPIAAKPLGNASAWITTADYPAGPLRRGIEGVTSYRLVVGSNGRVNACEITASSGNSQLDAATCSNLTRRARFEPATDGNGTKTVGNFNGTVRWQIPE